MQDANKPKNDTVELVSNVYGAIVGVCTAYVVDEIVANVIPQTNVLSKIIVSIGAFAIGDIAYDKVSKIARDSMYDFGSKLDSSIKAANAQAKQLDEVMVEI